MSFEKIWVEQCAAAEDIRERYGLEKALGYLVGEKLLNFLEASEKRPEFAAEVPEFACEIRRLFTQEELRSYLTTVKRVGPLGHVMNDEDFEFFREAGAVEESVVSGAQDVLRLEQAKELLLDAKK